MLKRVLFTALLCLILGACTDQRQATEPSDAQTNAAVDNANISGPVIVYSSRQEYLIKPLFDLFTAQTGIEVQYQTGEEGPLIARLQAEGEATFADVLYTVDAGNLWSASSKGLLATLDSPLLEQNIPEHLREPQGQWFGLSVRARTIVYAKDRVDPAELSTYAALADPEWRGRLCLRTSKEVYNISLVATMIERLGEEATQNIIEGWVDNLAAPVFSSDTLVIEAIAAGQCDVGLVNSYYLGRKQVDDQEYPVALFWANQETSGTHVNVSGAGITRYAKNPEELNGYWNGYQPKNRKSCFRN